MAGGIILSECVKQLGDNPDFMIRKRFLDVIKEYEKSLQEKEK